MRVVKSNKRHVAEPDDTEEFLSNGCLYFAFRWREHDPEQLKMAGKSECFEFKGIGKSTEKFHKKALLKTEWIQLHEFASLVSQKLRPWKARMSVLFF